MNYGLLIDIIREYAETIDDTLLPATTISSLGLKLALKLKPSLDEIMKKHEGLPDEQRFAVSIAELIANELDIRLVAKSAENHRISVNIGVCRFRSIRSSSLCTIENGIIGGLAFMAFGYCKVVVVQGSDKTNRPCQIDLYLSQTDESKTKTGIEFLRENIVLLKEGTGQVNEMQRRELRRVLLSLFNNLGLSLARHSSDQEHVEDFISALSCLSDIGLAVVYLVDPRSDKLVLTAHYGLNEETLPLAREVGQEINHLRDLDEDIVRHMENTDWNDIAAVRNAPRTFSSVLLKSEDRLIGVLVIGLSSSSTMSADFSENMKAVSSLLAASIDNSRLNFELEKSYMDMISMVNSFVAVVDRYSKQHSVHVADLAEAIGLQMGLNQDDTTLIYQAGFVHDIGKISIPPEVLNKEGKLTDDEFKLVKEHAMVGVRLLAPAKLYKTILPAIKHHHERLDGSGYPDRLKGKSIPLHARVIAVADVFDAMMAKRAHRDAHGMDDVIEELTKGKGIKYDADAVDALFVLIEEQRLPDSVLDKEAA
jgi:HD-GYP domain-containing protein (c-di-GMP phosphodiesterase class II)